MTTPVSPWDALLQNNTAAVQNKISSSTSSRVIKAKNMMNGSFDEPVRKGRKPEVSKNHPAVLECRRLYQEGIPLHRIAIQAGVEYATLSRWFDKGWMQIPRKRRSSNVSL